MSHEKYYMIYAVACESSDWYVRLQAFSAVDDSVKHLDNMWFRGESGDVIDGDGDGDGATTAVSISIAWDLCCANCLSLCLPVRLSACLLLTTSITCANKLQQTFAEDSPLPPTKRGKLLLHIWPPSQFCFCTTVPTKCYPTLTQCVPSVCVLLLSCCGIGNSMQMSLSHLGNSFENLPMYMTMRSSVCVCVHRFMCLWGNP